jgi:hypothetical protein
MNYITYILADKKGLIYWTVILIGVIILTWISTFYTKDLIEQNDKFSFLNYSYLLVFVVIFIGFYTSGFINYRLQNKFLGTYWNQIHLKTNNVVEIFQESVNVKPIRQSYDVKIKLKPCVEYFTICHMENSYVALGQVLELGIFRKHLKPICLNLTEEKIKPFKFTLASNIYDFSFSNRDLTVQFGRKVYGISSLTIRNLEKLTAPNNSYV